MKRSTPWLLLLTALLALAALLGGYLYKSRHEIEALECDRLVHQVNIIERNLALQMQTTSDALESVRNDLPELLKLPPAPNKRLQAALTPALGIHAISIISREGEAIASSRQDLLGSSLRDKERFQAIGDSNDPALLHISAPFRSPLDYWSITFGRSIRDADGNFAGIVLTLINPEYFEALLGSILYAPDVRAGLIHDQGKVIYRVPDTEEITGMDLSEAKNSSFYQHMQSGEPLTVFTVNAPVSGEHRMLASRTVWPKSVKSDHSLVAFASRDTSKIFAQWRADAVTMALLFSLLATVSVLGLFFFQRRQEALERVEAASRREREVAEERLRRSDERGRLATEGADIGIWYWDQIADKMDWSDITKRQLGLPLDQEGSLDFFFSAIHPDDRERVAAVLKRSQEILEDYRTEYRVIHRDGTELWLSAMGRYYVDQQGQVIGIGGATLDITERKQAELLIGQGKQQVELLNRQLEKRAIDAETAKRAKDAFLQAVSHELRTPLNQIMGSTDILLRGQPDARQEKWLRAIRKSAEELLELVQQVLFAAEEGGKVVKLEQIEFSPASVLAEVRQTLLGRAESKGLNLVVGDTKDLPERLRGDPMRLAQALYNYVDNSIKFSEQGTISLTAQTLTRDAESVVVRFVVSDTGMGIDPEVREKLFSTFSQGDSSMTRKHGGLGIGLSNTRELARLMGGEVGVDDVAGGGSAFWLTARFVLNPAPLAH